MTLSATPNSLNVIETVPRPLEIGIGISPPTRKVASWPGSVMRFGEESRRAWPSERSRSSVGASRLIRENAPIENGLPLRVFNLSTAGHLLRVARGEDVGTLVTND